MTSSDGFFLLSDSFLSLSYRFWVLSKGVLGLLVPPCWSPFSQRSLFVRRLLQPIVSHSGLSTDIHSLFLLLRMLIDLWSFFFQWVFFLEQGPFLLAYDVAHFPLSEDILQSILSLHMTVTHMAFLDGFLFEQRLFLAYSVTLVWVGALLATICHSFHDHHPYGSLWWFLFWAKAYLGLWCCSSFEWGLILAHSVALVWVETLLAIYHSSLPWFETCLLCPLYEWTSGLVVGWTIWYHHGELLDLADLSGPLKLEPLQAVLGSC